MTKQLTLKELLDKHQISLDKKHQQAKAGLEGALYKWGKAIEWRDTKWIEWEPKGR